MSGVAIARGRFSLLRGCGDGWNSSRETPCDRLSATRRRLSLRNCGEIVARLQLLASAADLFVAGSIHDEIWRSL
jgi:hypothetical protein